MEHKDNNGIKNAILLPLCVVLAIFFLALIMGSRDSNDVDNASLTEPAGASLNFHDGQHVYVTASRLNFRGEPSGTSRIQGGVSKGTALKILSRSGEWLKVENDGKLGWISAAHVNDKAIQPSNRAFTGSKLTTTRRSDEGKTTHRKHANKQEPSRRASFGKSCKRGQPCGNACISWDKVCRK